MTRIIGKQGRFLWWLLWLAAACLAAAVFPVGAQDGAGCSFSDVPQSGPQQADIVYACQQGWFQGYPGGTFSPDREVPQNQIAVVINRAFSTGSTRADLATFLRGGNPGDPDGSADFDDVAESHPQSGDIAYAVEQGWFQGYPDGTFRPDRTITPNQIATVASRSFPAGSTRADLATFMRKGSQALNDLIPPARKIAYTVPKYDSSGDQVALELWVAESDGSGVRRLTGDLYDDYRWQWSSDGESIAYQVVRELWVAEADGSRARQLTGDLGVLSNDCDGWGWSPDGERIAFMFPVHDSLGDEVACELWVAGSDGSDALQLTNDVGWSRDYAGPSWEWSPSGDRIAYSVVSRDFRGNKAGERLWVAGIGGSSSRQLTDDFYSWRWSPDGESLAYLVYKQEIGGSEYELWVVAVDGSGARRLYNGFWIHRWEWSPDGEWIAYEFGVTRTSVRHTFFQAEELWVVAVDGRRLRITDDVSDWGWSPDGDRIVYMVKMRGEDTDYKVADELWMMKLNSLVAHQLSKDFAYKWAWSSSGERIAFESRVWEFGKWLGTGLWVAEADGSNARQVADDIGEVWIWDRESIIYSTKVRNSSRTVLGSEWWVAEFNGSGDRQLTSDVNLYGTWAGDQTNDGRITTLSDGGLWVVGLDGSGTRKVADHVSRWAWQPRGDGPL